MSSGSDNSSALAAQVTAAARAKSALRIVGGDSKPWLGRSISGTEISTASHSGVTSYDPKELVITARAGTPLQALESVLADAGQMLPFEPPHFGATATIGGTIACGLSGPRRATSGSARDFVLGCSLINGRGEILQFGGQVIKNVAGYDVSRFVTGAQGTLGLLLEISMKVLPRPELEQTQRLECDAAAALTYMRRFAAQPHPISATTFIDSELHVRLSGNAAGVTAAASQIGGETQPNADSWWQHVREQTHPFFVGDEPLWRLSVGAARTTSYRFARSQKRLGVTPRCSAAVIVTARYTRRSIRSSRACTNS
jgi:glycolate oxidase FAD binding subunit